MSETTPSKGSSKKVANQYERGYDYTKYWDNRDYEHAAEEHALRTLLKRKHYNHAADIGGGFGRLCLVLREYADKVTLAEPAWRAPTSRWSRRRPTTWRSRAARSTS